ncbi:MAG TPA: baseplate J/gp47 family protein [Polyangiaceae bacterium]|nr:baseplate J/gp47 family protein [Polyangiaceae bacterium]
MSSTPNKPERDGTSQAARVLGALDPGYVSVDERTLEDLVAFSRAYGAALTYYGPDDKPAGDWSDFVSAKIGPSASTRDIAATVAAFMREPERFNPATSPELFRPHFVLFLAFLRLFERSQAELNALTGRHLDFYYRQVLRMAKKGPTPDQVNLIFDLTAGEDEVFVPRGTLLSAGQDGLGNERIYATDKDLVANRIQIAKLRSLLVERRFTGIRQAREQHLKKNKPDKAAMAMFSIALGHPLPGDPLPKYPGPNGAVIDYAMLTTSLYAIANLPRIDGGLFLSRSELGDLMFRKARTGTSSESPNDWDEINRLLEIAGRRKRKDPAYKLPTGDPGFDKEAFAANVLAAIGAADIEGDWEAIRALEGFFFIGVESFREVIKQILAFQEPDADPTDPALKQGWDRADAILEEAHREKIRVAHRERLRQLYDQHLATGKVKTLDPLIHYAMGDNAATKDDLFRFLGPRPYPDPLDAPLPYATDEMLDVVVNTLEVAMRNRLGEPAAEKEEWLYLYPADDATSVGSHRKLDEPQESPQWATFGLPKLIDEAAPPAPVLGWAITSPLLALSEGTRTITLTLGFNAGQVSLGELGALFPPGDLPLLFEISTKKGWVACPPVNVAIDTYTELTELSVDATVGVQFTLEVGASADPIAPLPAALGDVDSPWPVLRLMLRPAWSEAAGQFDAPYPALSRLVVVAAHVKVDVAGLKALKLQNDDATLDAKKPFEPFGSAPAVGSRFLIGHPEVVTKDLDSLTFHFQWMGAPADLAAHYANYADPPPSNFTAKVSLVHRGLAHKLKDSAGLFANPPSNPASISVTVNDVNADAKPLLKLVDKVDSETLGAGALPSDLLTSRRYLQWELNTPDFQHEAYPAVASGRALAMAVAIANQQTPLDVNTYKVNPPYTPKMKSLTLDYSASMEIPLKGSSDGARAVRVLHIHPFGHSDVAADADPTATAFSLLPRYENDGELYLGLRGASPPQTVSILFQLAEGSADPDGAPQPVKWSYLSGDRWIPLDDGVMRDTTRGLNSSGIVELALKPAAPSTRLRGGLYWVRAAVERGTTSVCDAIALHTQAMSATFVDNNNDPAHFRDPLPAATITKLITEIPELAGVRQPYTSFGGRMAEGDGIWATRVSERLRHKQRALSAWDYERIVLERFPEVYKAKCIPARADQPGKVEVVIIPDIRNMLPSDPFEPKAQSKLLLDVEAYLATRVPPFASVKVRNARYVAVRVRLRVRFTSDGNEGYYAKRLNDELNRFLSPWAYDEGADLSLGGRIYANSIIDFIDRRPYVDYVAGVALFQSADGVSFKPAKAPQDEGMFVEAEEPDAVLVAARTHIIDVLHDAVYDAKRLTGINFMKVELDFIVGKDKG